MGKLGGRFTNFCAALGLLVSAGCQTCPASLPVVLGNGSTVTAQADSGSEAFGNSVWAFYADTPVSALSFLGELLPVQIGLLFRSEFGDNGELVRVFDNEVLAPQTLGDQLVLDNMLRPTLMPQLLYAAESYAAQDGSSLGLTTCGMLYFGPLPIIESQVRFSGTLNTLLNRAEGTLTFETNVNPLFAGLLGDSIQSGEMSVDGFAVQENSQVLSLHEVNLHSGI